MEERRERRSMEADERKAESKFALYFSDSYVKIRVLWA